MSTLQDTLSHRRSGQSSSERAFCSADVSVPALVIQTTAGEQWVLPWSHFVSARHTFGDNREQLTLLFANHEVGLHGVCLVPLLDEIASFRLGSLRSFPPKYAPQSDEQEPFIEHVAVKQMVTPPSEGIAALC